MALMCGTSVKSHHDFTTFSKGKMSSNKIWHENNEMKLMTHMPSCKYQHFFWKHIWETSKSTTIFAPKNLWTEKWSKLAWLSCLETFIPRFIHQFVHFYVKIQNDPFTCWEKGTGNNPKFFGLNKSLILKF